MEDGEGGLQFAGRANAKRSDYYPRITRIFANRVGPE